MKAHVWGTRRGGKCSLLRLVMQTFPGRRFLPFLVQGQSRDGFRKEVYAAFRQREEGQGVFLVLAFSQSPSAPSRPYGKAGYFWEASSDSPQPRCTSRAPTVGDLARGRATCRPQGTRPSQTVGRECPRGGQHAAWSLWARVSRLTCPCSEPSP